MPPRDALFSHKTRDVALKVVSRCGLYRISVVNTTNLLQDTIDKHDLHGWEVPALDLMGTTISFTNLLASLLEGEERVECKFHAAFGASMVCESLALGECRAFLGSAQQGAMGNALSVRRVLYHNSDPVVSATVADMGEVLPEERHRITFQLVGDAQKKGERFLASAVRHAETRFNLNLTPHAFHYFKQSEGIPTAVLLTTSVEEDFSHLAKDQSSANGTKEGGKKKVSFSTGVLVQPLALNMEKENSTPIIIERLQDMFNSIALCPAPPTVASIAHTALGIRSAEEGCLLQDVLSLVSGDYDGALAIAKAARQMAYEDVETVRLQYQPIRERYGLRELKKKASAEPTSAPSSSSSPSSPPSSSSPPSESAAASDASSSSPDEGQAPSTNKPIVASEAVANLTALELDPASVVRTSLDFYCRCSAESITASFTAIPIEDRKDLVGKTAGCVYCNKEYVLEEKHLGLGACDDACDSNRDSKSDADSAACAASPAQSSQS